MLIRRQHTRQPEPATHTPDNEVADGETWRRPMAQHGRWHISDTGRKRVNAQCHLKCFYKNNKVHYIIKNTSWIHIQLHIHVFLENEIQGVCDSGVIARRLARKII